MSGSGGVCGRSQCYTAAVLNTLGAMVVINYITGILLSVL